MTALVAGTAGNAGGTLEASDGGFYVAHTNFVFPVGAGLRSATLQGYYSQADAGGLGTVARHAIAIVKTATGDTPRRAIVDSAKCGNCHEWFEAHGGNRVYEVQACVVCHNPNLSSSGRSADPATVIARLGTAGVALLTGLGYDAANPLTWPEESMNLRELIHGIHSSSMSTSDFVFARDRGASGVFPYDFQEVTYPNDLPNCEACHIPGTYDTNLPVGELAGTRRVPGATNDRAAILAARNTTGFNPEDLVTSPGAAACSSCHDNVQAINHMKINGAYVSSPRSGLLAGNLETCNVCHGTGRLADSAVAHKP
jgi:OmcA/MtrC family decaheme c-type cytochrome